MMKLIQLKSAAAQKIYEDYISGSKNALKVLSEEDRNDCLMEINSYIYEYMEAHTGSDEEEKIVAVTERLGAPEETLKEIIAAKKINQAVATLNPKHVIMALVLNIRNGVIYSVLTILFLLLLSFPVLIVFKLVQPQAVGLYVGEHSFYAGTTSEHANTKEVLGNYFIPAMILAGIFIYALIIGLLKIARNKNRGSMELEYGTK